ncbi:2-amino-4-hydroxy-6-hydroxymethyldihydropteridine diphosphokinase [Pseudidiomarina salinarum]|uniref:2-amino-4-hydroxy-6- hydroxymethyldihydropteridine diphosphokinase n=1 Tax=Pseudidiomarina salinarum TaxID=435908 RepID=UPI000690A19D|nr:2-amino-4-hydroxy-6-hydroxymethyldihydropteridine diphosphokinase [Pseudidiomarina salinarum]RUO69928.1 2-amino-4-hydroxy-6-hydroxymethyldihydropteridine diphosphokinase [Pseudidiomarina salinarum]
MARVFLGIGSNREREYHIHAGVKALHDFFAAEHKPLRVSRVFESAAVGFDGKPFYNLVAELSTSMSAAAVNQQCKVIEQRFGHQHSGPKFSPRTLDIDVLLYDQVISRSPVQLPRDEILSNAFVLWPLAELAPTVQHPVTGKTFAEIWQNYRSAQQLEPISFTFEALPHLRHSHQHLPGTI